MPSGLDPMGEKRVSEEDMRYQMGLELILIPLPRDAL
jgi:hypothetical protein